MSYKINGLYLGELYPDATVAGCVEVFENVWPNPEETINLIEGLCENSKVDYINWNKAETFGLGAIQNIRTNKVLSINYLSDLTNNPILQNVNNQFYKLLLSATNSYAQRYVMNETFWHEGYNLLKYSPGEEYKEHYDGGTNTGRCISAICYLNSNFEGGELEFVNFKIKIKPQPGMLILFPSNHAYRHIAHPIISGNKYALVTWIRDRQI
jgi:hypothetical protein